ncbi:glycerate kinase [Puia sp.]|jgi:glycerate kinase|uniref:glycerate kinase n=1 Tax=Puia sp. TaxID=2045100 RepID=UPI002F40A24A
MHILIAPNAYKNSLTAAEAADAIHAGLQESSLDCHCECFPIADGGDGTGSLLLKRSKGISIDVSVQDPLGRPITAPFGWIDPSTSPVSEQPTAISEPPTAIIELADASGLRLLQTGEANALRASTTGTGQLLKAALDKGARRIILCIGGSATVDGGIGILSALGARFLDSSDNPLPPIPEKLPELKRIDLSGLHPSLFDAATGSATRTGMAADAGTRIIVLCDVDNTLLGPAGSAAVFGPQKGASTPEMVRQLDTALSHLRDIVLDTTGKDMASVRYGGAAGGTAAGLYALLNAQLVNGADFFLQYTGFDASLEKAGLVITGEGSIDEQTLQGKGPFAVAKKARRYKIPVIGLAGKLPPEPSPELMEYFDALLPIGHAPQSLEEALLNTAADLRQTATTLGDLLALRTKSDRFE